MHISLKHLVFCFFIFSVLCSCRSKKTFNGSETLKCTTFKEPKKKSKDKKNSTYEIVVLKDGKRIGNKSKKKSKKRKGKTRLFKKK
jgi:hypothetical protein|tara:strand:+ start:517 stop:774 length:258 start_codon:yes stop_codon:yes gene_type:complete